MSRDVKLAEGRYHDRLLRVAERVFAETDGDDPRAWSTVIVVGGAACDAACSYALRCFLALDVQQPAPHLSAGRTRKVRELLRSKKTVNLKPKSQREIWETLTGDRLARWPDWIRYLRCVERRNAILHEGVLPSRRPAHRADAVEALEVTSSLVAHLASVLHDDPLLRDLA